MKRLASARQPASLLVTLASFASLLSLPPALADYSPSPDGTAPQPDSIGTTVSRLYTPPPDSVPPTGTTTTTTRSGSCSSASGPNLVPLAPQTHVGRTVSQQPTFAWFTPDVGDYGLQFYLSEYQEDGSLRTIYGKELRSSDRSSTGMTTLALQAEDFSLTPGTTYSWRVVLVCNPNRPSESLVAGADLMVASAPSSLQGAIATASSRDRVSLYAESGFWYDALAETIAGDASGDLQMTLLTDLANLEAVEAGPAADSEDSEAAPSDGHSGRLREVIEQLQ